MIKNGEVKYFQTFTVRGRGHFPMDMLRYDQCFPIEGVQFLEGPRDINGRNREIVEVKLGRWVDHWSRYPTAGRWASFGWPLNDASILTAVDGELIHAMGIDS